MTTYKSGEEELRLWREQASEEELRLWHNLDDSIRRDIDRLDAAAAWEDDDADDNEDIQSFYMTDAERQAIELVKFYDIKVFHHAGGANLEDNPHYEEFPDEDEWLATMTEAERAAYEDGDPYAWCAEKAKLKAEKRDGCLFWPFLLLAAVGVNLVVQWGWV